MLKVECWGSPHIQKLLRDGEITRFRLHTFQSRFESTSRGGLNPDSFKSYVTGSELKSSCERG